MKFILEYIPLLNLLALIYVLVQAKNWTGPSLHNESEAVKKEVKTLKANYERVVNDLSYYIRTNGDTSEMLTGEIKAIHRRLDQLNEFHERISRVEDNCLLHDNAKNILEAVDLINKDKEKE